MQYPIAIDMSENTAREGSKSDEYKKTDHFGGGAPAGGLRDRHRLVHPCVGW